jgi:hypothetical protein
VIGRGVAVGGTRVAVAVAAAGVTGVDVAVGGTLIAVSVGVGEVGAGTMSTVVKTYAPVLAGTVLILVMLSRYT